MTPNPYPAATATVPQVAQMEAAAELVAAGARPRNRRKERLDPQDLELKLVGHSRLLYWWPVWVAGYAMAVLSWVGGQAVQVGDAVVRFHPSGHLGLAFLVVLGLVITFTNITMRGLVSGLVIIVVALLVTIVAALGLWDNIFSWLGDARVYLNQGAYLWISTLVLVLWASTVFLFDRFDYWVIRPGQLTHYHLFGTGSETYDTIHMRFEKRRDDLFRHWLLGLGSGDLLISTAGATPREIHLPNVAFVASKIRAAQELIATEPTTPS